MQNRTGEQVVDSKKKIYFHKHCIAYTILASTQFWICPYNVHKYQRYCEHLFGLKVISAQSLTFFIVWKKTSIYFEVKLLQYHMCWTRENVIFLICQLQNLQNVCHFATHTCINVKMPISLLIYTMNVGVHFLR